MPVRSASKRRLGLAAAIAVASPAAAAPGSLDFDKTFASAGEPQRLHFRVLYRNPDGVHRLEVWRDGETRLKRVTDATVTTLVSHRAGDADLSMQVIDPRKHTSTRIDRASLYRIGNFTDWFDLAHGLRHPKAAYRLTLRSPLPAMPAVPNACRWLDLAEAGRRTSICWDASNALPLLIVDNGGRLVFRIVAVDHAAFTPATFRAADAGYIHDDATRDISGE